MSGPDNLAIHEEIECLARERLGWSGPLEPELRLVEDLGLDSLKLMELAVAVENRFQIRIDEISEAEIETVGDLASVIARELSGSSGESE